MSDKIEKALRPEVTREQMYAVIEHLQEAIEALIDDEVESENATESPEMPEASDAEDKMQGQTDLEVENQNGIYKSDNEDEDKWDNKLQKCWVGFTQVGMKEKGGKMVPNCVPLHKTVDPDYSNIEEMSKMENNSVWKGLLDPFDLTKRDFSTEQRHRMAESGHAMPDGSYPIGNKTDLMNAIRSWGRGGSDPKVKAHIKRRAKALGLSDMIPANWK